MKKTLVFALTGLMVLGLASTALATPNIDMAFSTLACFGTATGCGGYAGASNLNELSDVIGSDENRGVYWSIEDKGNLDGSSLPHLYALGKAGCVVADYKLSGVQVIGTSPTESAPDFEALSMVYRTGAGNDTLVLGDIGDGGNNRASVNIYELPEPTGLDWDSCHRVGGQVVTGTLTVTQYPVQYQTSTGATVEPNAEAMFVDSPKGGGTGDIWIIAKEAIDSSDKGTAAGEARVFQLPSATLSTSSMNVATEKTYVYNSSDHTDSTARITDAAQSYSRNFVVIRSYSEGWLWKRGTTNIKGMFDGNHGGVTTPTTNGASGSWSIAYLKPSQVDIVPKSPSGTGGGLEEGISFQYPLTGLDWNGIVMTREYPSMASSDPELYHITCQSGCP